jgi:hypothetical protein
MPTSSAAARAAGVRGADLMTRFIFGWAVDLFDVLALIFDA